MPDDLTSACTINFIRISAICIALLKQRDAFKISGLLKIASRCRFEVGAVAIPTIGFCRGSEDA